MLGALAGLIALPGSSGLAAPDLPDQRWRWPTRPSAMTSSTTAGRVDATSCDRSEWSVVSESSASSPPWKPSNAGVRARMMLAQVTVAPQATLPGDELRPPAPQECQHLAHGDRVVSIHERTLAFV